MHHRLTPRSSADVCRQVTEPRDMPAADSTERAQSLLTELLDPQELAATRSFLREPAGRRLAAARSTRDRAAALHDWLNKDSSRNNATTTPPIGGLTRSTGTVSLPQTNPVDDLGVTAALRRRRSGYNFDGRPMAVDKLATLLRHSVGISRRVEAYERRDHPLSLAPSAGGLNSIRVRVASRRVHTLAAGIYSYDMCAHTLVRELSGDPERALKDLYWQPEFARRASVTLILTAKLTPGLDKYSLRHYRTLHIDTGIVAQNIYLVATTLGLSCCAVAGFDDALVAGLLELDDELPTLLFAVGDKLPQPNRSD